MKGTKGNFGYSSTIRRYECKVQQVTEYKVQAFFNCATKKNKGRIRVPSNEYPRSTEAFPEVFGRAPFFLFEYTVKVGNIVEPAIVRHFCNGLRGVDQHA